MPSGGGGRQPTHRGPSPLLKSACRSSCPRRRDSHGQLPVERRLADEDAVARRRRVHLGVREQSELFELDRLQETDNPAGETAREGFLAFRDSSSSRDPWRVGLQVSSKSTAEGRAYMLRKSGRRQAVGASKASASLALIRRRP
jgi:hypothetical protein